MDLNSIFELSQNAQLFFLTTVLASFSGMSIKTINMQINSVEHFSSFKIKFNFLCYSQTFLITGLLCQMKCSVAFVLQIFVS